MINNNNNINMTKHHKYINHDSSNSPSIMEPIDETPSLTLKADLIDAMKPDILYDANNFKQNNTKVFSAKEHFPVRDSTSSTSSNAFLNTTSSQFTSNDHHHLKINNRKSDLQHTTDELKSINIHYEKSFLLMDGKEELRVPSAEQFCKQLGCAMDTKIKVVSIFGNTGDGKSHTMNHVFFSGEEIFRTSSAQDSCTLGVWTALQPSMGVLCLDTEGLLGATSNENQRMRMLLKLLAISDIVIYRTRSERLHSDMFSFLGTASQAFNRYFASALQSLGLPGPPQSLGPSVLIFHETRNTKIIESTDDKSAEDILRERFQQMNIDLEAFSSMRYIGLQTPQPPTDYSLIKLALSCEVENTSVRSPRQPDVIFKALDALNLKFSGKISEKSINPFPEQYFTCGIHCESCQERCQRSMGHLTDGKPHKSAKRCRYQHQYENKVFLCKFCLTNGREVVVKITTQSSNDKSWFGLAKYAWSGAVIECPNCGEIFRARQYWYGNKTPEDIAVRSEIVHVWKDTYQNSDGPTHSAQMVLDGVNYLSETVYNISAQPSKVLTNWMADKINPSYWKPNVDIIVCHSCKLNFEQTELRKHHCRGCGEGFCNSCSAFSVPVPARGWPSPVRVCNDCRDILLKNKDALPGYDNAETMQQNDEKDVMARKYGEVVLSTLTSVASVLEYPKVLIKDTARPSYWVPDIEAPSCSVCLQMFGTAEELTIAAQKENPNITRISPSRSQGLCDRKRHHCRSCGQGVCNACSLSRRTVPERGWTTEVRVCDPCNKKSKYD